MTFRNYISTALSVLGLVLFTLSAFSSTSVLAQETRETPNDDLYPENFGCRPGLVLINQDYCAFGCPDPATQIRGPRGYCYCPDDNQELSDNGNSCRSTCEGYQVGQTCLPKKNLRTFRRKFFNLSQNDNYLGEGRGSFYYGHYDFDTRSFVSAPATFFNYNRNYQLVHKGQCLAYSKGERPHYSPISLQDCNNQNYSNQFYVTEAGEIQSLDNSDFAVGYGSAHYFTPAVMNSGSGVQFEILAHPFESSDCEAGRLKVEDHCVCDPTHSNDTCVNNDGEACSERRTYRLGSECVPLRTVNRINNQFWRYFRTGFWVS